MYRPPAFDVTDPAELRALIADIGAAHLVTAGPSGLQASFLPLLLDEGTDPGAHGSLVGHLARANNHWRDLVEATAALALFTGPDAYVSPSAYPSKQAHGKVVPTWNYVTVHAHGNVIVHDDPAWVARLVRRLTDHHEASRAEPWPVDDAPTEFLEARYQQIVGIELVVTRLEGKRKLSQNRPGADIAGAIADLSRGSPRQRLVADLMEEA